MSGGWCQRRKDPGSRRAVGRSAGSRTRATDPRSFNHVRPAGRGRFGGKMNPWKR